jgi:lipopolysaccharide/colanic/teichoic acid biosynthesis glycosyltransferase
VKRLFDTVVAILGLLVLSPLILPVMLLVWLQDWHSPFYIAPRVGLGGVPFRMVKLRSMVINADRLGASSTSNSDRRITGVGRFIRKYKLDELMQLWNVALGDMSLVGPRPQVQSGVDLYTSRERDLLSARPGITDFASIVFSDEGAILQDSADPDADYDRLIRPWKSRLGLIYIANQSLWLDVNLIWLTILAVVSKQRALDGVENQLVRCKAPQDVIEVARRQSELRPSLPPDGHWATSET